ncbi:transposase [Planococcus lenghuensis]|uniref:Transposase n=1 Tax=Planococcus lenghuensis TaxID=2213202 RepID=A0A1Q2L3P5_9BACL|nr:transposase [Planococcus lenghuensis]
MARSTYYACVARMNRPDPDAALKEQIQAIYDEHDGNYGYRRICDQLVNQGIRVNHKKVQRLMGELGLKSTFRPVRTRKYNSYPGKGSHVAPNLLDRQFTADQPNKKWATDITEFKVCSQKLYLSPVLDLFNGEIITYTLGARPTYKLVSTMLDQALERLTPGDDLLLHSDQGWHYRIEPYRETLVANHITQSMSRKGTCLDNSVMENFFGIMKSEFLYKRTFATVEQFERELADYMEYYNCKRIKSKLNGRSPVHYRLQLQAAA